MSDELQLVVSAHTRKLQLYLSPTYCHRIARQAEARRTLAHAHLEYPFGLLLCVSALTEVTSAEPPSREACCRRVSYAHPLQSNHDAITHS
jgi:hypothetical protein